MIDGQQNRTHPYVLKPLGILSVTTGLQKTEEHCFRGLPELSGEVREFGKQLG
jgi:hypothetical protein